MNLFAIALLLMLDQEPATHAHATHGDISRPRVGVMSEQVVRQKLISYGIDIVRLEAREGVYYATVQRDRKQTVLQINSANGWVTEGGKPVRLRPTAKGLARAVKPNPRRVPWSKRAIRFDQIGVEGLRVPAQPTIK